MVSGVADHRASAARSTGRDGDRCQTTTASGSQAGGTSAHAADTRPAPTLGPVAILAGDSFEQRVGDIQVSGFVFDMWRIYEDFVCVALREAMAPYGGRSTLQHDMHLDESDDVAMRPDYVWITGGQPAAVADAKYKAEKPSGFPQADLYQILAYCTVLGLQESHLVYAKGNEDAREHSVIGADVTIHSDTLDLAQAPAVLLGHVETLASRIARTPPRDSACPMNGGLCAVTDPAADVGTVRDVLTLRSPWAPRVVVAVVVVD